MRKLVAKTIGYPLQDIVKQTGILKTLQLLKESQYWDEERIINYQSSKLKSLVAYAYLNVPYYTELFDKIKLKPIDIQSIDDLYKIPVLTKEIVRMRNMDLVAKGYDMRYVKRGKTGGTTGAPIIFYKDNANRSFTWASYYRWYEWMGLNYYDSVVTFWGAPTVTTKSKRKAVFSNTINFFQNELRIDSFELTDDYMWKAYVQIKKFKPKLIKGYLSALISFADYLERNNLEGISPKAISTTTETLLPHHRSYLERIFNAPIFDQYGCGEVSAISYECFKHEGLHINREHMICEILDKQGKPVLDQIGKIVGTDLDNYVMPFIRFENGDLSSVSSKSCTCGINQPLMNSIEGRTVDTIILKSGKKVHGVFFTDILYELEILSDKIQKFQVYQDTPGKIEFRIQCQRPLQNYTKEKLMKILNEYFENVIYSEHKFISSEANGKYRYIINLIK